ncbi:MAG: hypothetical protein HY22_01940 [[Candidatus Thermochlorobacteriaceae] bacterium GBChlB]|nr:MAG: hypothetical protein HY22_01940 [[Candidatus Thermochlorobacteriaceae] bacterium GBChlB]
MSSKDSEKLPSFSESFFTQQKFRSTMKKICLALLLCFPCVVPSLAQLQPSTATTTWTIFSSVGINAFNPSFGSQSIQPEYGMRVGATLPNQLYLGGTFHFVPRYNYRQDIWQSYLRFGLEAGSLLWNNTFSGRLYLGGGIAQSQSGTFASQNTSWLPYLSPGFILNWKPIDSFLIGFDSQLVFTGIIPVPYFSLLIGFGL